MSELRKLLRTKIHRATITHADLHYEGSITIPPDLLALSGILEYEAVDLWNVTSGNRLQTYAIKGLENSNDICVNGAAAHLMRPGDLIIIACFGYYTEAQAISHTPKIVFVDQNNRPLPGRKEIAGPQLPG